MSAEAAHNRELGEHIGSARRLARAVLETERKAVELEAALDRWLELLHESKGCTVYLTARAQSREDMSLKLIETYERRVNGRRTDWLALDYYTIGDLDLSHPEVPMLYLHRENDRASIWYFAYAFDVRVPVPPSPDSTD